VTASAPSGPWWDDRRLLILVVLAMAAPLLWPPVAPFVDLPGHLGRYRVQLGLASSVDLQRYYGFEWRLIGNLGIDLLVVPLAPVLGLERSVKLIVMAIPVLTAAGLLGVARQVHGRVPPTALFALPFAYAYPLMFGFVNFALSMALGLLAFAFWMRMAGRDKLRAILFVLIGLMIWVCHTFGWGLLGVLIFTSEWVIAHRGGKGLISSAWTAGLRCLPLLPPALLMLLWRAGDQAGGSTGDFFIWILKLQAVRQSLADHWPLFDMASLAIVAVVLVLAGRAASFHYSQRLGFSAVILFAVFLCLPRVIFGSAYADMRLFPYVLAIGLIAIRPAPEAPRRLLSIVAILGFLFAGVRLAGTTISLAVFSERQQQALGGLDHLPRGARLVSFVGGACRTGWLSQRLEHVPSLAIVRRDAFSNDQWALEGAQLLTIRKDDAPGYVEDPSQLVRDPGCPLPYWKTLDEALSGLPRNAFDYVWLIDPPRHDPRNLSGMTRLWTNGSDSLYRIDVRTPETKKGQP
jgi:hypothetical protein